MQVGAGSTLHQGWAPSDTHTHWLGQAACLLFPTGYISVPPFLAVPAQPSQTRNTTSVCWTSCAPMETGHTNLAVQKWARSSAPLPSKFRILQRPPSTRERDSSCPPSPTTKWPLLHLTTCRPSNQDRELAVPSGAPGSHPPALPSAWPKPALGSLGSFDSNLQDPGKVLQIPANPRKSPEVV